MPSAHRQVVQQLPAPPAPAPGHQVMQVQCPHHVMPGGQMEIATPDGRRHMVAVPLHVAPGQTFYCQVPLVQPPPPVLNLAPARAPAPAPAPYFAPPATNPELMGGGAAPPAYYAPPEHTKQSEEPPMIVQSTPVPADYGAADGSVLEAVAYAVQDAPSPPAMDSQPALHNAWSSSAAQLQPPLQQQRQQEMRGWLTKLGGIRTSWKKRWFHLQGGTLSYCETEGGAVKGTIELSACVGVVSQRDETDGQGVQGDIRRSVKNLVMGDGPANSARSGLGSLIFMVIQRDRSYVLQAESLPEMARWMEAIDIGINVARPPPAPGTMVVLSNGTTTKRENGGIFVEYCFKLCVDGQLLVQLAGRYSKLLSIHETLNKGPPQGIDLQRHFNPNLEFPAKSSWLTDDNQPEAIANRSHELLSYYTRLFTEDEGGVLLCSPVAHELLSIPEGGGKQIMAGVGGVRAAARQAVAAAQAEQQAAERAAIMADFQQAQNIQMWAVQPGYAAVLAYPGKQMSFHLKNKMFSFGDACVSGPGEMDWFRVLRQDGILWSGLLKNCQFSLGTMAGQPLIFLQEEFEWMTYRYSIYRTLPNGQQMLVCSIVRKILASMLTLNDQYEISCHTGLAISCQGTWPSQFSLHQMGPGGSICAATVSKKLFAWSDTYDIQLAPGTDVLLYLGIAVAIDRIHHEVEEKHRSRRY